LIDLRSDICTVPTEEMWAAMRSAQLGWATYGEDATVVELERRGAELLGKEAAVLVPTCTAANLAALLALAPPGGRVLVEPDAHIAVAEGDWLSHVARLEPGEPADVVCIENTHTRRGGTVLTETETQELAARAPRSHLDGARLANAAVALGVPLAALAQPVDTVALSLNKGLGAPFGTILAGDGATVAAARVHLKRIGAGTVHKAGIMAAAGLVALDGIERLAEDHLRARELARRIGSAVPDTNIVYAEVDVDRLRETGVLAMEFGGRARLVVHRLIGDDEIAAAAEAVLSLSAPAAAVATATSPATEKASRVPPAETSQPASSPPSGAPPRNAKK
jgi:threonine aldolase